LLHRFRRDEPAVARQDAGAIAHGHPGASGGHRERDDCRRHRCDRFHRRRDGRLRPVSFHPEMEYAPAKVHRSERTLAEPGEPFTSTPENQAKFDRVVTRYPPDRRKSAILYALYLVQEQLGYITAAGMRHVADQIRCTPAEVEDVVSYYTMFYTR